MEQSVLRKRSAAIDEHGNLDTSKIGTIDNYFACNLDKEGCSQVSYVTRFKGRNGYQACITSEFCRVKREEYRRNKDKKKPLSSQKLGNLDGFMYDPLPMRDVFEDNLTQKLQPQSHFDFVPLIEPLEIPIETMELKPVDDDVDTEDSPETMLLEAVAASGIERGEGSESMPSEEEVKKAMEVTRAVTNNPAKASEEAVKKAAKVPPKKLINMKELVK